MPTSIVLDATHFGTGAPTGVENYVDGLLPLLSRELLAREIQVIWIGHPLSPPADLPEGAEWLPSPHRRFWSQTGLLEALSLRHPTLFFTPSGLAPLLWRGRIAVTIHDLAAYSVPDAFTVGQRLRLTHIAGRNARRAQVVLTPSQYSRDQIHSIWKIPFSRIMVTPLAYSPPMAQPEEVEGVDNRTPYFLFVGRIELKKNLLPVIQGFTRLIQEGTVAQLVLAGKEGVGAHRIHREISTLPPGLRARVLTPGYVSEGQKRWLFEHAHAAIIPGLAEGSSIPILEAFYYGVPVICSNAGPLPELGKDAALYVGRQDPEEWEKPMRNLLLDPELVRQCQARGRAYAEGYNWEYTARLTAEALIQAAQR